MNFQCFLECQLIQVVYSTPSLPLSTVYSVSQVPVSLSCVGAHGWVARTCPPWEQSPLRSWLPIVEAPGCLRHPIFTWQCSCWLGNGLMQWLLKGRSKRHSLPTTMRALRSLIIVILQRKVRFNRAWFWWRRHCTHWLTSVCIMLWNRAFHNYEQCKWSLSIVSRKPTDYKLITMTIFPLTDIQLS